MKSIKELLARKRDGDEWTPEEVDAFVRGVVDGSVSTAQAAAFLMASCIRGLTATETAALTRAMAQSGDAIPAGRSRRPMVDKHSTGGVADSVSLLLTPLAVACGLAVPMISGRGLGHTGGTVDKLESVSGFATMLGIDVLQDLLTNSHMFMAGQSERIAPADRILYALRDVTGTVENAGLITASILSKKLAEGISGLVMDVKVGRAAFMKTRTEAEVLARSLQQVGEAAGVRMCIVFSRMDRPLGNAMGNWVEIHEAERSLADRSVAAPEMVELTVELVARMLLLGKIESSVESARKRVIQSWDSGKAYELFHTMISQQGGDWATSVSRYASVPSREVRATTSSWVADIDGMHLAQAIVAAGGGRQKETDIIDPAVGIVLHCRSGMKVREGEVLATVTASLPDKLADLERSVRDSLHMTTAPVEQEPSVIIDVW